MTEQGLAILMEIRQKVIDQGEPSVFDGQCRYRDNRGNKCAIGHLIPDDKYTTALENKIFLNSGILNEALRDDVRAEIEADPYFADDLRYMQIAHDGAGKYVDDRKMFIDTFTASADRVIDQYKTRLALLANH